MYQIFTETVPKCIDHQYSWVGFLRNINAQFLIPLVCRAQWTWILQNVQLYKFLPLSHHGDIEPAFERMHCQSSSFFLWRNTYLRIDSLDHDSKMQCYMGNTLMWFLKPPKIKLPGMFSRLKLCNNHLCQRLRRVSEGRRIRWNKKDPIAVCDFNFL